MRNEFFGVFGFSAPQIVFGGKSSGGGGGSSGGGGGSSSKSSRSSSPRPKTRPAPAPKPAPKPKPKPKPAPKPKSSGKGGGSKPSSAPKPTVAKSTPNVRVSTRSSTPKAAPKAAPKPAPKKATPTFKNLTAAARAGYHGKAVNIAGKGLQKVAFADKKYDAKMAKASAAKAPTATSAPRSAERKAEVEAARAAGAANPASYKPNKNLVTANPANVGNPAFSQPAPGTDLSNPNRTYFGQPKPPGYKEGTYINFTDMIDGGGPGAYGDKFAGGISGISNASGATPFGSGIAATGIAGAIDRGIQRNTNYTGGFSDMIDGGGPGTSGPTFGGALGPISNRVLPGPAGAAGGTTAAPTPVAPVTTQSPIVTPPTDSGPSTSVASTTPAPVVTPAPAPALPPVIASGQPGQYQPMGGYDPYAYSGQFAFAYPGYGMGAPYVGVGGMPSLNAPVAPVAVSSAPQGQAITPRPSPTPYPGSTGGFFSGLGASGIGSLIGGGRGLV